MQKKSSNKKYTYKEYLALEKASETRHDFIDGEIIPLEATPKAHNRIKRNLIKKIETPLFDTKGCELFDENVMTQLKNKQQYVYPDIVISCDSNDNDPLIVKHPSIIIEVLSNSTERYDRTTKFFKYQRIDSLVQCVFVSQNEMAIESFFRMKNDKNWSYRAIDQIDDFLEFPSLGLSVKVADIYKNIFDNMSR